MTKKKRRKLGRRKPKRGFSFFAKCPPEFGLGTIRIWSKNNPCGPHEVSAHCNEQFEFFCTLCGHTIVMWLNDIMKGQGCGHCSNSPNTPLCGVLDCGFCAEKSFASIPNEPFFQQKLREYNQCVPCNPLAHTVRKSSHLIAQFDCENCPHTFKMRLDTVTNSQAGCGYCANQKRCGDPECDFCTLHSVAANPIMLERWDIEGNAKTPYEVALNDNRIYKWICEHGHKYQQPPCDANKGKGCSDCKNKTEGLLTEFFIKHFGEKCFGQKSFEWCKHIKRLRFDFNLKRFMSMVECDGKQHYVAVKHFNRNKSLADIQARDRYKENCAIANGYSIIRVKQEDVWNDVNNWQGTLLDAIDSCRNGTAAPVQVLYPELVL